MLYTVKKRFISGTLKGITITETSNVFRPAGFQCLNPVGGSGYVIDSIQHIKVQTSNLGQAPEIVPGRQA